LNHQPSAYKAGALPLSYASKGWVRVIPNSGDSPQEIVF
jgi:hypothetical protein